MPPNLRHLLTDAFPEHLDAYEQHVVRRVLPTFDTSEEESDRVGKRVLDEEFAALGDFDEDDQSIAELAVEAASEYRATVERMRQAMQNLLAVGLFHIYEQQAGLLKKCGLNVDDAASPWRKTDSYDRVQELRHICHTSKHAEGKSAKKLRGMRADIMDVTLAPDERGFLKQRAVEQPLAGEGVFVEEDDLLMYCDAIKELWMQVWDAVREPNTHDAS